MPSSTINRPPDSDLIGSRTSAETDLIKRFRGKTAEEWRAAYADAYDWGADVGDEAVEE